MGWWCGKKKQRREARRRRVPRIGSVVEGVVREIADSSDKGQALESGLGD
jgi:hypothetical protein